jgi:toxin YoeB
MNIIYSEEALNDLKFWVKNDKTKIKKIDKLIQSILINPISGLGKPEALKHQHSGKWSREIDKKNRLIYCFNEEEIIILIAKGHYGDK